MSCAKSLGRAQGFLVLVRPIPARFPKFVEVEETSKEDLKWKKFTLASIR